MENLQLEEFEWQSGKLGDRIGKGSYAKVYELEHDHTLYAAKKFRKSVMTETVDFDGSSNSKWKDEGCIWSSLRHPNIVTLYGITYKEGNRCKPPLFLMEKMEKSLFSHLKDTSIDKKTSFPLDSKVSVLTQTSKALVYLHKKELLHGDLTANNILLSGLNSTSIIAKVSDFGISRSFGQPAATSTLGSQCYMPPEVDEVPPLMTSKIDIYSVGVLAIHTVIHKCPKRLPASKLVPGTESGLVAITEFERFRPSLDDFDEDEKVLLPLVEDCLRNSPGDRPEAKDIVERLLEVGKNCALKSESLSVVGKFEPTVRHEHNITNHITFSGCTVDSSPMQFIGSSTVNPESKQDSSDLCQDVATHSLPIEEGNLADKDLEGDCKVCVPQDGGVGDIAALKGRESGENSHQQVGVIPVETSDEISSLKEKGGLLQVGKSPLLKNSAILSKNGNYFDTGVSSMDQSKETTAVAVEMTPAEQDSVQRREGGTQFKGSVCPAEGISLLSVETTPPEETTFLKPMTPLGRTSPLEETTSREGGTSSEDCVAGTTLKPAKNVDYHTFSQKARIPTSGTGQFPMQFQLVKYSPGQYPLYYYVPGCTETGYDVFEKCKMDEGVATSPCSVVELDDSLYFYSQRKFQVNKMCRGGQRAKIVLPEDPLPLHRAMYSVAATTNPSVLHVIWATVTHVSGSTASVERITQFTIVTLNKLSLGEFGQYFKTDIPLLPVPKFLKGVHHIKLVSLGIGSVLFVGIAASAPCTTHLHSKRTNLMLMAIDLSSPSPLWVMLAQCYFNVDSNLCCNHQLLQYNKSLLLVCGRKALNVSLDTVMKAVKANVVVDSNAWVLTPLPINEGKLVVCQSHLLSVGGLTGISIDTPTAKVTHVYEDDWQASGMVYFFEPESKEWFPVGKLNRPRFGPALFVKNCGLFVVGGQIVTVDNRYAPGSWYELFEGVPADEVSVGIPDFSTSCIKGYFDSLEVGTDSRRTQA
jgi:serine/threonine protein kinase